MSVDGVWLTTGVSKEPEDYKGNLVHIVGRERILALLGIEEEPTDLPPTAQPPPSPIPNTPVKPPVTPACAALIPANSDRLSVSSSKLAPIIGYNSTVDFEIKLN